MASNGRSTAELRGDAQSVAPPPASGTRQRENAEPYIVLVGLDLSEPGGRAWRFAFDLAALKGDDSEVHAVIVGARAMEPMVRDIVTPGVSTVQGNAADATPLPPLKVLEHRSAGGKARLMAMH